MECYLTAISHHLPRRLRTNADLLALNPGWDEDVIYRKTGIRARPVAADGETALDLGCSAAEKLFNDHGIDSRTVDLLIFVTESPDYVLPPNACILQHRLELPTSVASFDVSLGCSGFVYGLALARSAILGGMARRVLLICAETYSRYCDPHDLSTVTLFGDGAAAALLSADSAGAIAAVGTSVLGTDGSGQGELIVAAGGARQRASEQRSSAGQGATADQGGGSGPADSLKMNGPEVFRFALDRVKPACDELLERLGRRWADVDVCLCHQANRFMLEALRKELGVPAEKLPIDVEDVGNLSTASLPVFISRWHAAGGASRARSALAIGFGVGFSWGVTWLDWHRR